MNCLRAQGIGLWSIVGLVIIVALLPLVATDFFVSSVMTRVLLLATAASSLVFLSAYGGMVSLAQWLVVGVAGFMIGNAVAEAGSKGLKLGWNPWVAVVFAIIVAVVLSLALGALSSRTTGIYYLMLTLTYAVIGFFFFGQVTQLSGFGGITGIDPPGVFDSDLAIYYVALVLSVGSYAFFQYIVRTPFGMALQGVRDDPVRMASLGHNVSVVRMMAFTIAGLVAALAGIGHVWWKGQIDPTSIGLGPTLDLLIIAVVGGISRLEGAWIGAFVFVMMNVYIRSLPLVDRIGITEARFNTVIGIVVLLIMVLSPEGLAGIGERIGGRLRRTSPPTEVAEA